VFWLLPPLNPVAQALLERGDQEVRYLGLLRNLQREFPNVTVLDARHCTYEPAVFCDTVHLNRRGATALSRDMGALMASLLANHGQLPRWVELPRFAERAEPLPVEDLAQSRIALQTAMGVLKR
jgi:hypothetical protein